MAALLSAALANAGCTSLATPGVPPQTYLLQARQAVAAQQPAKALSALTRAEDSYLAANPTRPASEAEEPPVVRRIGLAREAVKMQQWGPAEDYINAAISALE